MSEQKDTEKQETGTCGPGCGCGASGSGGPCRWIAGVVILVIAGVLVAKAVVKNSGAQAEDKTTAGFVALPAVEPVATTNAAAVEPVVTEALKEIASFAELNTVAMGSAGVFIYVPGKGDSAATSPVAVMRGAAKTIEPQLRGKVGLFALKAGSPDYDQISGQMPVPGVIALVPGGRMVPVTGEITESKLVQGFVGSVQSCGAGGCGSGCG